MEGLKTEKRKAVASQIEHYDEVFSKLEEPIVLMWTEYHNDWHQAKWPGSPKYRKDDEESSRELRRFFPLLKRELMERYTIRAVKANCLIRKLVPHRGSPDVDDDTRTFDAYRQCLPRSSHNLAATAIVLFPAKSAEGHPLLMETRKRRLAASATSAKNAKHDTDVDNGNGLINNRHHKQLVSPFNRALREIVEDMPLFQRQLPKE